VLGRLSGTPADSFSARVDFKLFSVVASETKKKR